MQMDELRPHEIIERRFETTASRHGPTCVAGLMLADLRRRRAAGERVGLAVVHGAYAIRPLAEDARVPPDRSH